MRLDQAQAHRNLFLLQQNSSIIDDELIIILKGILLDLNSSQQLRTIFFPRIIILCLYRELKLKKPRWPHTTVPKPHQMKTSTSKTQYKNQPQTPHHHK